MYIRLGSAKRCTVPERTGGKCQIRPLYPRGAGKVVLPMLRVLAAVTRK